MIQALIFDLGNVLISTNSSRVVPLFRPYLKYQYEEPVLLRYLYFIYDEPRDEKEQHLRKAVDQLHLGEIDGYEFYDRLRKHIGFTEDLTYERFRLIWPARFDRMEGSIALLKRLKRYSRYLLSDTNELDSSYLRKHHTDIFDEFDHVYFSYEVRTDKKQDEAWLNVVKESGYEIDEHVFIDDREDYVRRAREIGMKGIVFTTPQALEKELMEMGVLIK